MAARIAVFASGGGSNLQALIDHFHPQDEPVARVVLVVASRPGIGALERARSAAVDTVLIDPETLAGKSVEEHLVASLEAHRIDWIVLAGYLQMVPAKVVARYGDRIVNVHPALLPSFGGKGMYGLRVHRAVIESGARVSGATVHLVDDEYDRGRILAQWPVPVLPGDSPESLAARVLKIEHRLLPLTLASLLSGGGRPRARPADPLVFELARGDTPDDETIASLLPPA